MEENFLSTSIDDLVKQINTQRESILKESILEKVGKEIDINEENKRRFPRIAKVLDLLNESDSFYWNDGTESGLHLVTFYRSKPIKSDDNKIEILEFYKK